MTSLKDLNLLRNNNYKKDPEKENFLLQINNTLLPFEQKLYKNIDKTPHPFVFVFGLPRSGTTLMAQVLAHGLNMGYINNFAARFWLTPLTGLKLSQNFIGKNEKLSFSSDYATTNSMADIHEFGYFWRHWLKKESTADFVNYAVAEKNIDWKNLKNCLLNIQDFFDKPMLMKNIFGVIHAEKITEILQNVLWVHIIRDKAETATSIYDARMKFYGNANTWWATVPPNYENIKHLEGKTQIASQVQGLSSFYDAQMAKLQNKNKFVVNHTELVKNPNEVLQKIAEKLENEFSCQTNIQNISLELKENKNYNNRPEYMDFKKLLP